MLKLPEPISQPYLAAPLCFTRAASVQMGHQFFAFGFPQNRELPAGPGTLGTQNAEGARWAAASAFTYGMSGGPVYSKDGFLIGMVKGGLENTDAVRWITPITFAEKLIPKPWEEVCPTSLPATPPIASLPPSRPPVTHIVTLGAERLLAERFEITRGKRIGLITNQSGRVPLGHSQHLADLLQA